MSGECQICGEHCMDCRCESICTPPQYGWISVDDKMPNQGTGRYLIKTKCNHFAHKALAWNWAHPCGKINIAYYDSCNKWHYETGLKWDDKVEVTHWMPLPTSPE